jgi:hypothetical protein
MVLGHTALPCSVMMALGTRDKTAQISSRTACCARRANQLHSAREQPRSHGLGGQGGRLWKIEIREPIQRCFSLILASIPLRKNILIPFFGSM